MSPTDTILSTREAHAPERRVALAFATGTMLLLVAYVVSTAAGWKESLVHRPGAWSGSGAPRPGRITLPTTPPAAALPIGEPNDVVIGPHSTYATIVRDLRGRLGPGITSSELRRLHWRLTDGLGLPAAAGPRATPDGLAPDNRLARTLNRLPSPAILAATLGAGAGAPIASRPVEHGE